jgi:hypothetical protein
MVGSQFLPSCFLPVSFQDCIKGFIDRLFDLEGSVAVG